MAEDIDNVKSKIKKHKKKKHQHKHKSGLKSHHRAEKPVALS